MKKLLSLLLLSIALVGCASNEVEAIYDVPKTSVVVVDNDVVFEYGGQTYTAKGQANAFESDEGDYIKVLVYEDGKILIAKEK